MDEARKITRWTDVLVTMRNRQTQTHVLMNAKINTGKINRISNRNIYNKF